jgi:hypothetical protein
MENNIKKDKMKRIIGIVDKVKIIGEKEIETYALFDTGATRSSIDFDLAARAKLGPIMGVDHIKAASSKRARKRPIVKGIIEIKGKRFKRKINLEDRSHLKYPVIIGRNLLRGNFIIDVEVGWQMLKKGSEKDIPVICKER